MRTSANALFMTILLAAFATANAGDIYLVRHAEKQPGDDPDPGLTHRGLARAQTLADLLASADIQRIFSSNYRRTRLTAAPLAIGRNIDVELYDPRDLGGLAERLMKIDVNVLVVGHSNTTPQLVNALGGDAGSDISEGEYDRLYLVQPGANGSAHTILLHLPPRHED